LILIPHLFGHSCGSCPWRNKKAKPVINELIPNYWPTRRSEIYPPPAEEIESIDG